MHEMAAGPMQLWGAVQAAEWPVLDLASFESLMWVDVGFILLFLCVLNSEALTLFVRNPPA